MTLAVPAASKVLSLEELAAQVSECQDAGKRVVHCHGVFDLLHIGHIRHLQEARTFGDLLVVTITPDEFVNKGPHRPAFTHALRAEALAALDAVDFVAVNRWPSAVETIHLLRPNVFAKGPDYKVAKTDITGHISLEEEAISAVGGELVITDDITFSSSNLLNDFLPAFDPPVTRYLRSFRQQYSSADIAAFLQQLGQLRVLVVGEAIVDEYVYCDALGKSSKEPIIAMRRMSRETHAGGALAIANHISEFCRSVDLLTYLGEADSHEKFVRSHLRAGVRPTFLYKAESPTITKTRFVEQYSLHKVFEVYDINDQPLSAEEDRSLCRTLEAYVDEYDVVLAADFGHGLITQTAADLLTDSSRFLAVNTQANAANLGFHTISKYRRADYICLQESELRLDARRRDGDVRELVRSLAQERSSSRVMVTRGKYGTIYFSTGDEFVECPSFAVKVVDRVGAGDAVFALTSLCAAAGVPADVLSFLANVAGAETVATMGNSSHIQRVRLQRSVESLLK